ncbi:glycosyltransferase family 2 protein [Rhodanobacter denitrificans]|uniref:Glycosyltransferase family 2 protein n=1 Tax=Rhodanobacter denitrificans TaxID=666685 RepID=A0A368KD52_9GAMM|nr:glycosyltransferase family 2 protein [Rhodanobacter denitrificans]RCS29036.1 glycosyltransferase family 2 protein [Rhodanobacter denitrificans]
MTHIKLSICIATRNRADYIGETLRSIVGQATDAVEIVVLDGASTDATPEVVAELRTTFPRLRYVRKERNGGVDCDYDAAVVEAQGVYCWLMSDDDLLKPGAIARVLDAIDQGYSLVVVNAELRSLDLSELIDASRLQFGADRTYRANEFDRLFDETSAYLSYIGAVVIRHDVWMAREREPFFGSYFIHEGVIFQHQLPGSSFVIAEPLISIRFGNTQWRPKEFEIRMIRWPALIASLAGVSEDVRHRRYPVEPWRSFKSLFFYRAKGTYDLGEYRRWVRPRVHKLRDRARAFAIACFPGMLANLIGLLFCRLPYRDSNVHLLDMKASRFFYRNWFKKAPGKP